jgi:hypothetical protein
LIHFIGLDLLAGRCATGSVVGHGHGRGQGPFAFVRSAISDQRGGRSSVRSAVDFFGVWWVNISYLRIGIRINLMTSCGQFGDDQYSGVVGKSRQQEPKIQSAVHSSNSKPKKKSKPINHAICHPTSSDAIASIINPSTIISPNQLY